MAEQKAITMTDNSWGGDKRRLGLGTTHQVPGEVSAEDAEKLVASGKARWCEAAESKSAASGTTMTAAEIRAELDRLGVAYKSSDNKATLLALLPPSTQGD
ncbi:MAG: hypothetical protein ACYDIB_07440 [Desulfobulbia bacterium]